MRSIGLREARHRLKEGWDGWSLVVEMARSMCIKWYVAALIIADDSEDCLTLSISLADSDRLVCVCTGSDTFSHGRRCSRRLGCESCRMVHFITSESS